MPTWEFERDGEVVKVDPTGPLIVRVGAATDLAVDAAVAGSGVIHLFEDWLRPHLDSGALEPVLEPWWQRFLGAVPLLSRPAAPARAAARLRRFHRFDTPFGLARRRRRNFAARVSIAHHKEPYTSVFNETGRLDDQFRGTAHMCKSGTRLLAFPGIEFVLLLNSKKQKFQLGATGGSENGWQQKTRNKTGA